MASSSNDFKLKPSRIPQFKPGSLVEVCSYDDGFRGSWYIGKVIRQTSSKNPEQYLVEYQKLFEDDEGKIPLQEILDWPQLRPLAPREKKRKFRFGEKVDAFHSDGWWEGSITKECEDGKFAVFFRGSREQIEFGEEELRLHREWIDGEWKPPLEEIHEDKKRKVDEVVIAKNEERVQSKPRVNPIETATGEFNFNKGMLVEVCSEEEGFEGAWFVATIVESMGNNRYLIEYKALRTEDDTNFLKEVVEAKYMRPSPPETIMINRYKVLEEVDAFYNDGWWVGVVAKVLANNKYNVYFRESREELTFRHDDLRLHQDWISGQWRTPSSALMT